MSATASPPTPCPWNRLHPSQKPNDPCSIQRCLNAPCYRFKGADRLCEHQLSVVKLRVARFFFSYGFQRFYISHPKYSVSLWHPDANWWNSGKTQKSNFEPRLVIFCYLTRHYTADWGDRSKKITTEPIRSENVINSPFFCGHLLMGLRWPLLTYCVVAVWKIIFSEIMLFVGEISWVIYSSEISQGVFKFFFFKACARLCWLGISQSDSRWNRSQKMCFFDPVFFLIQWTRRTDLNRRKSSHKFSTRTCWVKKWFKMRMHAEGKLCVEFVLFS
jgi:hypothetical protein